MKKLLSILLVLITVVGTISVSVMGADAATQYKVSVKTGSYYTVKNKGSGKMLNVYGKDKVKDYYQGYAGILSSYGFQEQFNFANPDGGEVVVYLSADGKYSLEYGLTIDAKLGEVILIGITEVPA